MSTLFVLIACFAGWRHRQCSLVAEAIQRADLAPIPDDAEFTHVSRYTGFIVNSIDVDFKAPPESVSAWWKASPGTKGAHRLVRGASTSVPAGSVTSIPPVRYTVFELRNSPHNKGAQVAMESDGTVKITVFTM